MDQAFRLFHDGRRRILEPDYIKNTIGFCDMSNVLLDSAPLYDMYHCKTLRFLSKFPITLPYNKLNANRSKTKYRTKLEIGVRNFIKAFYSNNNNFGMRGDEFKLTKDLISFIYGYSPAKDVKISVSSISHLKNRSLFRKPVPRTNENLAFVEYVKRKYPYFRDDEFLKEN
jgi:hypothetical protein